MDVVLELRNNDGVTEVDTVMVRLLLDAVVVVAHEALLVSTQEMISPLARLETVYVDEFVPTLLPFFFH